MLRIYEAQGENNTVKHDNTTQYSLGSSLAWSIDDAADIPGQRFGENSTHPSPWARNACQPTQPGFQE
jgi:hypothetical protein